MGFRFKVLIPESEGECKPRVEGANTRFRFSFFKKRIEDVCYNYKDQGIKDDFPLPRTLNLEV